MTENEAEAFVAKFAAAWADRSGPGFLPLWHEDGLLQAPHWARPIAGREQAAVGAFMRESQPHLVWRLVDWTHRGERVCILWETENRIGERVMTWRGVDWITLRDGKIVEEIVYYDTAPLHAAAAGTQAPPLLNF